MRDVAGVRVLLVEDHDLLSGTLALALRSRGIDAETCKGPTVGDVLEAARRFGPRLVLLDLDLGALGTGRDLIGPLRATGADVVMLTGVTDRAQLAACVEAGASGVLAKTIPFDDLLDAVDRLVAGEALLGPSQREALLDDLRRQRARDHDRLAPFQSLTAREQAVLAGLVAGESAEAIAERSYVSLATVRSQIRSVLAKLGVNSQLAAVALARSAGWPPFEGRS